MFNKQNSENGQVIVIIALSLVVMLGFTALALDGGMLYSDRRHAQNAADAASLAGATEAALYMNENLISSTNFLCGSGDTLIVQEIAESAAVNRAGTNGYTIDKDASDKHGVTTRCEIVDKGSYLDKHIDIHTYITRETKSNFAHLVFAGALINEVDAITRVYPPGPLAYGHAIVAINQETCSGNQNGVIFSGSSDTKVTGGGVWSSGCLTGNGTGFSVQVNGGVVTYAGESTGTLSNINPYPEHSENEIPEFAFRAPPPDCSSLPNRKAPHGKYATLEPGVYERIQWTSGSLTLEPGLYCITDKQGIVVNGGSLSGDGVTIYLQTGGMTVDGSVDPVDLRAPTDNTKNPAPAIPGILIYMAQGNTSTIKLTGNSSSEYLGTIYATSGDIYVSGSSGTNPTFHTQLIGNNVEVSGGATIDINFLESNNYEKPPALDVQK